MINTPYIPREPYMSESDCATHLAEKHERMIRNELQAGREIPMSPVSVETVGEDVARPAVEASQRSMKRATRRTFAVPALPWKRNEGATNA